MPTPIKPLKRDLNFFGWFGGFPLVSTDDWRDCVKFRKKAPLAIWGCSLTFLLLALPCVATIVILTVDGFPAYEVVLPLWDKYATWKSYGIPVHDIVAQNFTFVLLFLSALLTIHNLVRMATPLSRLNDDIDDLAPYTILSAEIKSITKRNRGRIIMLYANLLPLPFLSFFLCYHRFSGSSTFPIDVSTTLSSPNETTTTTLAPPTITVTIPPSFSEASRITASLSYSLLYLFVVFTPPLAAGFLLSTQYIEFVTAMIRNFRTKILPPSRRGKLFRPGLQRSVTLDEGMEMRVRPKEPPPQYKSRQHSGRSKGSRALSIPSYKSTSSSHATGGTVVHDVDTILDYGNDIVNVVEKTNKTFGPLLATEALTDFISVVVSAYLFMSFPAAFRQTAVLPILFVVAFALLNLLVLIMFAHKLASLTQVGQNLQTELKNMKSNLSEVSTLKFRRMDEYHMFEMATLRQRLEDTMTLTPAGFFSLNRATLAKAVGLMVVYLHVLVGFKMSAIWSE